MISSEVHRTLVKSPPELWSELSDPESLARHLAELGDIRITRVEPEQLVEWEAESTTGRIQIKASGWGTKVTLSVSRELPIAACAEAEAPPAGTESDGGQVPEPLAASAAVSEPFSAAEPEPEPADADQPERESTPAPATAAGRSITGWPSGPEGNEAPSALSDWSSQLSSLAATEAALEPDPVPLEPEPVAPAEPQSRRGFFARLFGGRRRASTTPAAEPERQSEPELEPEPEPASQLTAPEPVSPAEIVAALPEPALESTAPGAPGQLAPGEETAALEHIPDPGEPQADEAGSDEPAVDLAAELLAAEETAVEEVRTMLVAVLDRLGAAHHRPFSRA
jgi:hypothetical protein